MKCVGIRAGSCLKPVHGVKMQFPFLPHTSSPGLTSCTARSWIFVPSNTITQFGLQSWFNRDKLRQSRQEEDRAPVGGVRMRRGVKVKEREDKKYIEREESEKGYFFLLIKVKPLNKFCVFFKYI